MGQVWLKITKPIRNYNIETRAFRELDRQLKAKVGEASPGYRDARQESSMKPIGDVYEKQQQMDPSLVERVSKMDITTKSTTEVATKRPLPQDTTSPSDMEYGFHVPSSIPRGKVTLPQALDFLTRYKEEYPRYTTKDIAKEYNISQVKIDATVRHFQMLNIFLPKKVIEKAKELEKSQVSANVMEKLTTVRRSPRISEDTGKIEVDTSKMANLQDNDSDGIKTSNRNDCGGIKTSNRNESKSRGRRNTDDSNNIDKSGERESNNIDKSGERESNNIDKSGERESNNIDKSGERESKHVNKDDINMSSRKSYKDTSSPLTHKNEFSGENVKLNENLR